MPLQKVSKKFKYILSSAGALGGIVGLGWTLYTDAQLKEFTCGWPLVGTNCLAAVQSLDKDEASAECISRVQPVGYPETRLFNHAYVINRQRAAEVCSAALDERNRLSKLRYATAALANNQLDSAKRVLQNLASKGDEEAAYYLGDAYLFTNKFGDNRKRLGVLYLAAASNADFAAADFALSWRLNYGMCFLDRDISPDTYAYSLFDKISGKLASRKFAKTLQNVITDGAISCIYPNKMLSKNLLSKSVKAGYFPGLTNVAESPEKYCIAESEFPTTFGISRNEMIDQSLAVSSKYTKLGDLYSHERLGEYHEQGLGVPKNLHVAFDYYEKGAKLGSPRLKHWAACYLDSENSHCTGVRTDQIKAKNLYSEAADQNYIGSLERLAFRHCVGQGETPNQEKCLGFLSKAYKAGSNYAAYSLGQFYAKKGNFARANNADSDSTKAEKWYQIALASPETRALDSNSFYKMKNWEQMLHLSRFALACRAKPEIRDRFCKMYNEKYSGANGSPYSSVAMHLSCSKR